MSFWQNSDSLSVIDHRARLTYPEGGFGIWLVALVFIIGLLGRPSLAITDTDRDIAIGSFIDAFYVLREDKGYFAKSTDDAAQQDFWRSAELMEMVIDAWERTGNTTFKVMIDQLYAGFTARYGNDWMSNTYNDDIIWMVIACCRAYQATAKDVYRHQAKVHFDRVYQRAYDKVNGGGLYWTTAKRSKNACINCPAAIAAMYLHRWYADAYKDKAVELVEWVRSTLWDGSTGQVYDSIRTNGRLNKRVYTYNQGTFIGACNLLYLHDSNTYAIYREYARRTLDFTINNLCVDGILTNEGSGDGGGFKGIFCRWATGFIRSNRLTEYYQWLQRNAQTAWDHRNPSNLCGPDWLRIPSGTIHSFDASSAVVLFQVCP